MTVPILAFAGKKGSGKDTCATYLRDKLGENHVLVGDVIRTFFAFPYLNI